MTYDAFIFDFDGVIADSVEVKTKAFAKLFSRYGADIEKRVVDHHRNHGGMTRVEKFKYYHAEYIKQELTEDGLEQLCKEFSSLVVDDVVASDSIAGAREFIEQWHDKVPCFVDSATPDNEIIEIVKRRGLSRFFKGVFGSGKSKTDNLKHILSTHGLDHAQCIFWGDAHSDYAAAQACRVNFIGIVPGENSSLLKKAGQIKWYHDFNAMQDDPHALTF